MPAPKLKLEKIDQGLRLSEEDQQKLADLEAKVENSMIDLCVSLAEIRDYNGGIFWNHKFASFPEYVKARFGYEEQHAGRLVAAGKFVRSLEDAKSNAPKPTRESQIRPILNKLPESHQIACWELLTDGKDAKAIPKITADIVDATVVAFRKTIPEKELNEQKKPRDKNTSKKPDIERVKAPCLAWVRRLPKAADKLPRAAEIKKLLQNIKDLINEKE